MHFNITFTRYGLYLFATTSRLSLVYRLITCDVTGHARGPYWKTAGDVFYGANVQRQPLPLISKEGRHHLFSYGCTMFDYPQCASRDRFIG